MNLGLYWRDYFGTVTWKVCVTAVLYIKLFAQFSSLNCCFLSVSVETFRTNFVPGFRDGHSFFSVFAIFFPAATGILAGANISGDLRDAQRAIPKGTLVSILSTTVTYLVVAWMAGGCVVRDALGPVSDVAGNSSWLSDNLTVARNDSGWLSHSSFENETDSCSTQKCKYGLLNDMQVSQLRRLS